MLFEKSIPQNDSVFRAHIQCMKDCHEQTRALRSKGDMKCVVMRCFVVLFKKEAARENPPFILRKIAARETVCRGKLWAIKRGER